MSGYLGKTPYDYSLNTPLPVSDGGTGSTNSSEARTKLGLGTASTVNTGTASGDVPTTSEADGRYAALVGSTSQTFEAANAAAGTQQVVPIAQADSRYMLSGADGSSSNYEHLTASHTLVASDSGKVFDFWHATSNVTLTYNTVLPGFTCAVVAPQSYSVTISVTAGYLSIPGKAVVPSPTTLTINPLETAYIVSFSQGYALYVFKTGRTIVADAVNANEAVAYGQTLSGGTESITSNVAGTVYTNSSSRPRFVEVHVKSSGTGYFYVNLLVNGTVRASDSSSGQPNSGADLSVSTVVMPGDTYEAALGFCAISDWREIS